MNIYRYTRKDNPNYRVSKIFDNMNSRAWNRDGKNPAYENIGICEEWDVKKTPYNEALADFVLWAWTHGYNDTLTIDRLDNSKGYSPDNCQWADRKTQNRNKGDNHPITVNGITYHTIAEAIEALGREEDSRTIRARIYKHEWEADRAFNEPIMEQGQNSAKPVTINGIAYKNITEACRALNLKRKTVYTYKSTYHTTAEEAINHYIKETQP